MRILAALALLVSLSACATTGAGKVDVKRNATNTCNFAFLAALPGPHALILSAALCSFGVDLLPDEEEADDDEEGEDEEEEKAAKAKKPKLKVKGH